MDLRPIAVPVSVRQKLTSWADLHRVLVDHQPVERWWWRTRCSVCGGRWSCEIREYVLEELAGRAR